MNRERTIHESGSFTFKLLGGVQILYASKPLTSLSSAKARALLIYLALNPHRHSRDALAVLLWPNMPKSQAKTNLRQVLTKLRQTIPDLLTITRQEVGFNADTSLNVDVLLFEDSVVGGLAGERLRLEEAADLYVGDFLAGFYVEDAEPFDEWMVPERERLRGLALQALEQLIEQSVELDQVSAAVRYTRQMLQIEPWREEGHRHLIRLLASQGERGEALAQFEECRRILQEELGVVPSPETIDLVEQLRSDTVATKQRQVALDWGDAPELSLFLGRDDEVAELSRWIAPPSGAKGVRLVTILAMGGTGKTTLAAKVATTVADSFDFVFWRSLLNAPPLDDWLRWALNFLSHQQLGQLPDSLDERLALLFKLLNQHRCLLIWDNVESILQPDSAGVYRAGYEPYGQLVQRLAQGQHRSCLLLTSRERPRGIARLEEDSPQVRTLRLDGLATEPGQLLLAARRVSGSVAARAALIARYSGNPLALKLVADTIQEFFDGDITLFLDEEMPIFDDIRTVLDQQFARLSLLERDILVWLAIERTPTSYADLVADLVYLESRSDLLEALRGLQRRSLLDKDASGFSLQNVVSEYIIDHLNTQVYQEIVGSAQMGSTQASPIGVRPHTELSPTPVPAAPSYAGRAFYLDRYALLKAQANEHVRQSQIRLILAPIAVQALGHLGVPQLQARLQQLLNELRAQTAGSAGYAGGNLLNLLLHFGLNPRFCDFSYLNIRQAYLRGARLPNLQLQGARLIESVFTDTFGMMTTLAFNPNGQFVAGGTGTGEIRLWQVADGSPAGIFADRNVAVWSVAFSPDGALLASSGDEPTIHVRTAESGQLLASLHGESGGFNAIAFSPNGNLFAGASYDGTVQLWDVPDPKQTDRGMTPDAKPHRTFTGHTAALFALAFSPDGTMLATAGNDLTIHLWDVVSGETHHSLVGHSGRIYAVAFSPDGRQLASCSIDNTVCLWNIATGQLDHVLEGHTDFVRSVAFSSDGQTLASGSYDETIRLWDVASGQPRSILSGHRGWIRTVTFSPDGATLASGSFDYTVRLWDIAQQRGQPRHTLQGYAKFTRTIAFSPDGSTLAGGGDERTIDLWDVVKCLASDGPVTVLADPQEQLLGHDNVVRAVAFSPDGTTLASGSFDHTVRLWDVRQSQKHLHHTLYGHTNWVRSVAFSPDGQTLASASWDQTICLWDVPSGQLRHQLRGHTGAVWSVAFSPDGMHLLSGSTDETLGLWHVPTGKRTNTIEGHTDTVKSVAFSPDGKTCASSGDDQTIRLWDIKEGTQLHQRGLPRKGHTDIVWSITFSPDGNTLASASEDQTIRLWDVRQRDGSASEHQILRGHTNWIWSAIFSPDGNLLASCSLDQTIKLWHVGSRECLQTIRDSGPYAGMNITGVTGISDAQKASLRALGAIEH